MAAVLLLPLPAAAQEVRARDLSIVEDVLVETVQLAIQTTVRSINTENLEAQESARAASEAVPIRYVFRSGAQTQARGMFLEDYGAIFTVQVPSMSYTNSAYYSFGGNVAMVSPGELHSLQAIVAGAGALGEEMQLRAQMARMDSELAVLRERLEAEVTRSGATSESAQALRNALETWETAFDETQRRYSEYIAGREAEGEGRRRAVARGDSRDVNESPAGGRGATPIVRAASPEEIAAAEDLAVQQRNQIEGAIIDSVIEALSQYGRIMHGLENSDRLAVVLLPSSYLNPIGSWARATQRDEEFTISVRFQDVMDLDRGNLSDEDFRAHVRIERRLGQPR